MNNWWQRVTSAFTGNPACRRKTTRPSILPRVEELDDRTLPSTFTVLHLADGGPGSLRQAIAEANAMPGADQIAFAPGLKGTLGLTGGELAITDDLTIDGPGEHKLTISGSDASRVFHISGSDTDVTLNDLTIADGRATGKGLVMGGGVLIESGIATVSSVTFDGNVADVSEDTADSARAIGGAVAVTGSGSALYVDQGTFLGNHTAGVNAGGGAIANIDGATLGITASTFVGNQAAGEDSGSGGALLNDVGSVLAVNDTHFNGNSASAAIGYSGDLFQGFAQGGAIANQAGSVATISESSFNGNYAKAGDGAHGRPNGGFALGGAIFSSNLGFLVRSGPGTQLTIAQYTVS
jgi:hypothetical protein